MGLVTPAVPWLGFMEKAELQVDIQTLQGEKRRREQEGYQGAAEPSVLGCHLKLNPQGIGINFLIPIPTRH